MVDVCVFCVLRIVVIVAWCEKLRIFFEGGNAKVSLFFLWVMAWREDVGGGG